MVWTCAEEGQGIGRGMFKMEQLGIRQTGRLKRKFVDVVREDMKIASVTEEDAEDRTG